MTAIRDIKIKQGASFWTQMILSNDDDSLIDLTGYRVDMWLKRKITSKTAALELSTETGEIVLDPTNGKITIQIDPEITDSLRSNYLYDLKMTSPGGQVTVLFQGKVVVSPKVTE